MAKGASAARRIFIRSFIMNNLTTFTFKCPSCGKEEIIARPIIFDAAEHPAEAKEIAGGTYLTARCTACGETQDFLMNMLYVDRAKGIMVALQPNEALPLPPAAPGMRLRVVRDAEDLADKIRELASPIDDRLIEIAKYLLYLKVRPALPAGSAIGMPAFHESEDAPTVSLPMDIKDKGYAMATDKLTKERLAELEALYGPALAAEEPSGFAVIDREYAKALVECVKK